VAYLSAVNWLLENANCAAANAKTDPAGTITAMGNIEATGRVLQKTQDICDRMYNVRPTFDAPTL
jgi:hypothetical protein